MKKHLPETPAGAPPWYPTSVLAHCASDQVLISFHQVLTSLETYDFLSCGVPLLGAHVS